MSETEMIQVDRGTALSLIAQVQERYDQLLRRVPPIPDEDTHRFILLCETTVDRIAGSGSRYAAMIEDLKRGRATSLNTAHALFLGVLQELRQHIEAGSVRKKPIEFIILIHGIRTFAWWQRTVKTVLEEIPNVQVIECQYDYFTLLRFWCPFFTRRLPIDKVRHDIELVQDEASKRPGSQISVIAHSYGTYAISEILQSKLDLRLNRLVLCGSIIRRNYPWHTLGDRISPHPEWAAKKLIINDYGTKDVWPVLAKCLSWGYGDTGRHKFGKTEVIDRGHNLGHSGFFENPSDATGERFVREYWKPFFENGTVVPSKDNNQTSPWWLAFLSILRPELVVVVLALALFAIIWTTSNEGEPGVIFSKKELWTEPENRQVVIDTPIPVTSRTPYRYALDVELTGVDRFQPWGGKPRKRLGEEHFVAQLIGPKPFKLIVESTPGLSAELHERTTEDGKGLRFVITGVTREWAQHRVTLKLVNLDRVPDGESVVLNPRKYSLGVQDKLD